MRKGKIIVSFHSYPTSNIKFKKNCQIGWKRPRKRENKNYRFVPFLPDALWKIPKNSKKIQKIKKKYHYGLISSQNRLKEDEKERK